MRGFCGEEKLRDCAVPKHPDLALGGASTVVIIRVPPGQLWTWDVVPVCSRFFCKRQNKSKLTDLPGRAA